MGKTHLAIRYAREDTALYPNGIFWLRADTQGALWDSFLSIARQCARKCIVDEEPWTTARNICNWLSKQTHWLVIFDNADQPELIQEYKIQLGTMGRMLLTTRVPYISGFRMMKVNTFVPRTGAGLLLRRAALDDPNAFVVAKELSRKLGGLALALDQAGAFVEGGGLKALQEYSESFEVEKLYLLGKRTVAYDDPEEHRKYQEHVNVVTTHTLALRRLECRQEIAALQLVHLLAFLAPQGTFETTLKDGADQLTEPLKSALTSPVRWKSVLQAASHVGLVQTSIIEDNRGGNNSLLIQHHLTREVLKELLEKEERKSIASQAVALINSVTPNILETHWREESPLLPQWIELVRVIQYEFLETEPAIQLMENVAMWLQYAERYLEAEPLYQYILNIPHRYINPEESLVATSMNNMAELYRKMGRHSDAERLYVRSIEIHNNMNGSKRYLLAAILNNMAELMSETGRYIEAEPLYRQALKIDIEIYGVDHPDTAIDYISLGILLLNTGREEEGLSLVKKGAIVMQTNFSEEHPWVKSTQRVLEWAKEM